MHQKIMMFGGKKHNVIVNRPTNFHTNPIHHSQEIEHHHLQPFCSYLYICATNDFDFWYGEELE
jgi:hypothetical protein